MKLLGHRALGFTLVEIMIVATVIALLAAIYVPSFLRARKRTNSNVLADGNINAK
jgi:prepilin-type N-terminal cleavage/methylation domain-containing protein